MARILIVDDDEQIRKMLCHLFSREGFDVAEAPDGKIAIRLHRKTPADLIILDLIMPEMEGIETIRQLKVEFPDVKIIAITGGGRISGEDNLKIARMLGAARTFTKPIENEKLKKAVKELLGESSPPERRMEEDITEALPIDMDELREIMDGNEGLIVECFQNFLETMPENLEKIRAAIVSEDASKLDESAHKFKGALKYLAASRAASVASHIELMGKRDALTHVADTFQTLLQECEKVKAFITRHIG